MAEKVKPLDFKKPSGGTLRPGAALREIKMLVPVCETCQGEKPVPVRWWTSCKHGPFGDPYWTLSKEVSRQFVEGEDGTFSQVASEKFVPVPNTRQVTVDDRHGSFNGRSAVEYHRSFGWILPEEHETRPVKAFCQYKDCYSQDLKQFETGMFCRKAEAKLVYMEQAGTAVEVFNDKIAAQQMSEIAV